jgi:serine/threonine protein kinase
LIDFGLSLQVAEDQKHRNIAGTSFFMAPEILDDKQNVDGTGKVRLLWSQYSSVVELIFFPFRSLSSTDDASF